MEQEQSFHMTPDQFRRHGKQVVDWVADYYERVETLPVLSRVHPGEVRELLPIAAPVHGESFESLLRDVSEVILPGVTHWQSPNFFAYFPANASGPAILGDLLSSALGVQGMLWATSPACTELETHVLDWLVPMLGLPEKFLSEQFRRRRNPGHCFQFFAVRHVGGARARYKLSQQSPRGEGRLVAYTSTQAHSSHRESRHGRRHRHGKPASHRGGRPFCNAPRVVGKTD